MHQKEFTEPYLIIGSVKHVGKVDSYNWMDDSIRNVDISQYKTIILHFDAIPSQLIQVSGDSCRIIVKREQKLELLSNMDKTILANIQWINGHLLEIEDPAEYNIFIISSPINRFNVEFFKQNLYIPKLLGDELNIVNPKNSSIPYGDTEVTKLYFEYFSKLSFTMRPENNISMINANDLVKPYFDEFNSFNFVFDIEGQHSPMAHTFYNAELAFSQMILEINTIVLPHPRMVSPYDTVEIILRKIIGIQQGQGLKIPNWIDNYNTVRQKGIIKEISGIEREIDGLKRKIKEKKAEFSILREFQQILFTKGKTLRESLFRMFQSLGMKVVESKGKLSHDIELESADSIFIIQVLNLEENTLERSNLRQLNQWVEAKEETIEFTKKVKGVALVSYQIDLDPSDRDQLYLDEAAKNYISKLGFCILTTPSLFEIYNEVESGDLGKFEILDKIAATVGIFLNLD